MTIIELNDNGNGGYKLSCDPSYMLVFDMRILLS